MIFVSLEELDIFPGKYWTISKFLSYYICYSFIVQKYC